ncbi:uncharacterized protein [Paralichthys olivaceus]|uniref:uncharacterized protein n=1 Tax=Paralichthys olivaceus TaxID=8255 RepID=UPI0037518450
MEHEDMLRASRPSSSEELNHRPFVSQKVGRGSAKVNQEPYIRLATVYKRLNYCRGFSLRREVWARRERELKSVGRVQVHTAATLVAPAKPPEQPAAQPATKPAAKPAAKPAGSDRGAGSAGGGEGGLWGCEARCPGKTGPHARGPSPEVPGRQVGPADRPFTIAQQLRDAARRWLQPGGLDGEKTMLEKIVLEQLVEGLPDRTAAYVRCHRPATPPRGSSLRSRGGGQPPAHADPPDSSPSPPARHPNQCLYCPPQVPTSTGANPNPPGTPRMSGQECWKCGQPGHFREACPLMAGDSGCRRCNILPRFRSDIPHSGKDSGGCTSGYGGFWLRAVNDSPDPDRGIDGGMLGEY